MATLTFGNVATNPLMTLGSSLLPGGVTQIASGTQANPTEITTVAPHGLTTGDRIFFTSSTTANVALTASPAQVVTVTSSTKFTVPVDCSVAGATAGAYDFSIRSTPAAAGVAPLVNVYRAHGLRVGDIVTIIGSGSTPDLDGAQTVTEIVSDTAFRVKTAATPTTVSGSITAAHYSKTTYYSDVLDRGGNSGGGAVTITSVIGTAPNTVTVNLQGSADGSTWWNVPYALVATPRTFVITALTITTGVATTYLLQEGVYWRYLRAACSSSTNVQLSFTANLAR